MAPSQIQTSVRTELTTETLHRFGFARIRVQGSSMLPVICPGDEIGLQSIPFSQIEAGRIVAFRRDDRLFVHRVIAQQADGCLRTQGDALVQPDAPVQKTEYLGVVVGVVRDGVEVGFEESLATQVSAALFRRSQLCAALFVKFASL